jgi:D-serine deaminase-like pyridoxal phosphate-dependent protein
MATLAQALSLPDLSLTDYRIREVEKVLTPALAIYPEIVDKNIAITTALVGSPDRWRPHIKTAKLAFVMRRLVEQGVTNFKCSTSLELLTACEAGARDVLLSYPAAGRAARRVSEIAREFPAVRVSALVESVEQIGFWKEGNAGLFIDINPGMNRTGIEQVRIAEVIGLAHEIETTGLEFRGLHYYDGHMSKYELSERFQQAHRGYDQLMKITAALFESGISVQEVITAGTPALPCTISYEPFRDARFIHRASPGTVVYSDCTSLAQLPAEWGYRPAAVVVATVVSRPSVGIITCDAGHKTVSADAGAPTCRAIERYDLTALKPSEEHLPMQVGDGATAPLIGETLYLVPRHICPTVNNFDHALIVEGGEISDVERVSARGREAPLNLAR